MMMHDIMMTQKRKITSKPNIWDFLGRYTLYIVIVFVLEAIYLAITLLLVLFSVSCWCT
jgi:hypothetical protein